MKKLSRARMLEIRRLAQPTGGPYQLTVDALRRNGVTTKVLAAALLQDAGDHPHAGYDSNLGLLLAHMVSDTLTPSLDPRWTFLQQTGIWLHSYSEPSGDGSERQQWWQAVHKGMMLGHPQTSPEAAVDAARLALDKLAMKIQWPPPGDPPAPSV